MKGAMNRNDFEFYRGMLAALAVVATFDKQVVFDEIVNTANVDELVQVARRDGIMRWSGLSKYGYGKRRETAVSEEE